VLSLLPIGAAALGPGREPPERGVTVVPSQRLSGGVGDEHADRVLTVFDPALPASLSERTGVNAFFHQSDSPPIGSTASQILSAVPAGGVVHFACHARAESGTPLRNAIILPGGDQITVAGILDTGTHSPAARMVVLSACESGLAGPYVIDETISLPAAFLAAGYGGVVSTLWEVEDVSTALLMLQFYWQWRHEQRLPSLALARAQHWQRHSTDLEKCAFVEDTLVAGGILDPSAAETLAQQIRARSTGLTGNSYSEPYYWAGFSFSGR
jgi:CHAT domain-containing protein